MSNSKVINIYYTYRQYKIYYNFNSLRVFEVIVRFKIAYFERNVFINLLSIWVTVNYILTVL